MPLLAPRKFLTLIRGTNPHHAEIKILYQIMPKLWLVRWPYRRLLFFFTEVVILFDDVIYKNVDSTLRHHQREHKGRITTDMSRENPMELPEFTEILVSISIYFFLIYKQGELSLHPLIFNKKNPIVLFFTKEQIQNIKANSMLRKCGSFV